MNWLMQFVQVSSRKEDKSRKQIYELLSDGTVTMNLPEILK